MTSQRLSLFGLLLFIASQTLAAEKPSPSIKRNFPSQQQEGLIGITEALPLDNPADNIFHVTINEQVCAEDKVWLVYELDGVEDHSNVARSVNDQLAVGGYVVKKRRGWALQREELNGEWLKQGDNVVRFTLPSSANHSYRVKNLRVEIEKGAAENDGVQVVFNQPSAIHYQSKAYIKGFVRGDVSAVRIGGKNILFTGGEFESLIDLTLIQNSCTVDVEVVNADGSSSCHAVNFSESAHADYVFTRDGVYYEAETFFNNKEKQELELHGAHLMLEGGALQASSFLSITTLRDVDIPALDAGMVNVTAKHAAFRFLPNGTKFGKDVKLTIPFDTKQIPDGYTEQDIKTYYFDEQNHHWVPVPTDTVLLETGLIISNTTHFTDYINAIIKVPESPEVNAYNSTSMKGIKAANPTAAVNLISPPQANNSGSASLGYPINIPAGRAGMQPQLNVSYNSAGGNGWMGLGWNLTIPSINIDIRWGVPRYDSIKETETYSFNGEQLSPVAHKGELQPRTAGPKQFHPRVEGSFNKIIRYGNHPSNYWWVVTDKSGTKYFYGAAGNGSNGIFDKDAVLRTNEGAANESEKGNIAQWCLREVRDLNGNTVRYHYGKPSDKGVNDQDASLGHQIYIERIDYTGFQGGEGVYKIFFEREGGRPDKSIVANLGFKQVTGDRLKRVIIKFDKTLIRKYEFEYVTGEFLKTLLQKVTEFDSEGNPFTSHSFEYYNDVRTSGGFKPFEKDTKTWTVPFDNLQGDFITNFPGFTDEATALSGTKSSEFSFGIMAGVGFDGNVTSKSNSIGGSYNFSKSTGEGVICMIDINGDGLQDKVLKKGSKLVYQPNLLAKDGAEKFGTDLPIEGINLFQKEKSKTNSLGAEAVGPGAYISIGYTHSTTTTTTSTYFTEANGDQFPDIVKNGVVYFNHFDPASGKIQYTTDSKGTGNEIIEGGQVSGDAIDPVALENERQQAIDQNPLHDVVRMWRAPYAGKVRIDAPVRLIQSNHSERAESPADGVRLAIQMEREEKWVKTIAADDYNMNPVALELEVNKGTRVFFRVGSRDNGAYDSVLWNPVITYKNQNVKQQDANNKLMYVFNAEEDFLLAAPQTVTPPMNGTVRLTGPLVKPLGTDDVDFLVIRKSANAIDTVWRRHYRWDDDINLTLDTTLLVTDSESYSFKVLSETNINWSVIQWLPKMAYTQVDDPLVNLSEVPIEISTIAQFSYYVNTLRKADPFKVVFNQSEKATLTVTPDVKFSIPELPFLREKYTGDITFSVKKADSLLLKKVWKMDRGEIVINTDDLEFTVADSSDIFTELHIENRLIAGALTKFEVRYAGENTDSLVVGGVHTIEPNDDDKDIIFGTLYRGWGHFIWNGNRARAEQPIDIDKLKISDAVRNQGPVAEGTTGQQMEGMGVINMSKELFIPLMASGQSQYWMGQDPLTFISAARMSSSRFGDDDLSVLSINPGDGSYYPAIDKITKSESNSYMIGGGAGPVSGSATESNGTSRIFTDFSDMNGDRYPDIVSERIIQFTNANGSISNQTVSSQGESYKASNHTTGATLSGSAPTGKFHLGAKGGKSTDAGDARSTAGLSLNAAAGTNNTQTMWVDMNGDGLPDRVSSDGMVALNIGYGFLTAENWMHSGIQHGESTTTGGGLSLGVMRGQGSLSLGYSLAKSSNKNDFSLMDINSDGLPDLVNLAGSSLSVRLNTGTGFVSESEAQIWQGINALGENKTASESGNLSFTIGFTLLVIPKIIVNPSFNGGFSMSREHAKLSDINGDGYPDFMTSENDGDLKSTYSAIGRTNLLKEVKRPLGATFSMNYKRVGNTYELPSNNWVLDSVKVYDGFANDGVDNTLNTYAYENGYYDRHEREFYGFEKVISRTHDTSKAGNPVYTEVTQIFNNDDYFNKGLLLTEVMADGAGNKYVEKKNTYSLIDVSAETKFPSLATEEQKFYEGQSSAGKSTSSLYQYDAVGNVIAYTDRGDDGDEDNLSAVISYHDIDGLYLKNIPKRIVVTGNGKTYRKRETVIDPATGDVKQIKQYLSDSEISVHDMEYDIYGNLTKITRPANNKGQRMSFNYEYDATVHSFTTKVSNSYGYSSTAEYDFSFGQLIKSVDINGHEITYVLDKLGRITSVTGPYEKGGANKTIEFKYSLPEFSTANPAWALTNHYDPANPKNSMQTAIFVDGLGRVIQTKKDVAIYDGDGKPDKEVMVVSGRMTFDAFGRMTSALYPITEPIGTPTDFNSNKDTMRPTTTEYDVLNRTLKVTLPDLSVTNTSYGFESDRNGKKQFSTKTTDANGKQTEQFTDVRGRVTSVKNYTSTDPIWTSFKYNAINEQIEATDDQGHTTFSTYDNFGRRIERKHPDAGTTQYSYDLAGNLKELITANLAKEGGAITYSYDFERLTGITYPHNPENNVKYTYGAMGATDNRAGRIVTQEDASGAQEFFYGPLGEVVKNIRTVVIPQHDEQTYTTEWTYDTWNRLTSMVYADGEKVEYIYNAGGLLRSMSGKKKSESFAYVNQLGYDKFEQRVFLAYGNGTKTTYSYEEDRRRLKSMTAQTSSKRLFMDNVYGYDKVNNILSLENNAPIPNANLMGGTSEYSFEYDDLYRLTSAQGSYKGANDEHTYTLAMSYNTVGGITQKVQNHQRKTHEQKKTSYNLNYTYSESQPHAPIHIGDQTFTYDANGNQTGWTSDVSGQRRQLMWDEENRIRAIQDNGSIYHYIYDASGERVLKGKSTGQRVFVNGEWKAGSGGMGNYTVYVNPYLVLKSGGYTKHYYIEGQRVVSKLGSGIDGNGKGPLKAGGGKIDYAEKGQRVFDGIVKNLKFLGADGQILTAGKSGKIPPGQINGIGGSTAESFRYFFHPDHLGSTSFITDAAGEVYQHLEYTAFGETFVEEHSNTERTPYLFNGKELDEETGLYYYGARYYDARTSVWQSVDPQAERGPGWSAYNYNFNNPVRYIDPTGMWPEFSLSDVVHTSLDVVGLVPGFGEIADGVNAVIYLAEGNYTDAALSAAAMIPLAGTAATVAKLARKADKAVDIAKAANKADGALKALETAKDSKKTAKNASAIAEGKKFEADELQKSISEGKNATGRNRLVPQNGKGNIQGNRTDTDQLIKNKDNTYSIVETKRTSSTKQSAGQNAAESHVKNGDGIFEIRSTNNQFGLKPGDKIKVVDFLRVNKYDK